MGWNTMVYDGRDLAAGRTVYIEILRSDRASDSARARFRTGPVSGGSPAYGVDENIGAYRVIDPAPDDSAAGHQQARRQRPLPRSPRAPRSTYVPAPPSTTARAQDWQTQAMLDPLPLRVEETVFKPSEWTVVRRGVVPQVMEDKWFVYLDRNELRLFRSWTGREIYRATFAPSEDGSAILTDAEVEADPERYGVPDRSREGLTREFDHLLEMIDVVLLHRPFR